jgi:HAD superfamily hydrolase (TIGR01509 family)
MKTSVVLFDAAGVLFPLNKVVGEELQRRFNLSEERLRAFWTDGLYKQLTIGKLTTDQFLRAFAKEFELPEQEVTRKVFVDVFEQALEPVPGIRELLQELKDTGVHLALLSDTVEMYADIRHELGYYSQFEKFFFSYETGFRKPTLEAYQVVTDFYRIPAEEIFFIDDTQKNVEGAIVAGMRSVRFTNANDLRRALVAEGVLT